MPYKDLEKRKQYYKEWRRKHPNYDKEYYETHKKEKRIYARNYQREHRKDAKYRERQKKAQKKYRLEHKNRFMLYGLFRRSDPIIGKIRALFDLGGCCIWCIIKDRKPPVIDPFFLQPHHPYGRKERPEFMIHVCRKCHKELDRAGYYERSEEQKEFLRNLRKGLKPWNKGLTKKTDERIQRISQKISKTLRRKSLDVKRYK